MENLQSISEYETSTVKANKMDPSQFDATMKQLLIGQGAEKYLNIFRLNNIGQSTLAVLTEADLVKLGVDDTKIRKNIITMVKDMPIFEEISLQTSSESSHLSLMEMTEILTESADHLNRIYISLYSNTKALSKEGVADILLYEDKYSSDLAITTLKEISNVFDSMENVLLRKIMVTKGQIQKKKLVVGAVGSAVIFSLAVLFVRSLKQL